MLYTLAKSHLESICTEYVCDKSENARVCAKWQWNALDWYYWIALPALPVMQSSNTVSCVSMSFRTHPCVLTIYCENKLLCDCEHRTHHRGGKTQTEGWWSVAHNMDQIIRKMKTIHRWKPFITNTIANQTFGKLWKPHVQYCTLNHTAHNLRKSYLNTGWYCLNWIGISTQHK